mgnify:FL=1
MVEDDRDGQAALQEAQAAVGEVRKQITQLQRQQRELQILMRQVESELQQIAMRKGEREERVRIVEANPGSFSQADVREAYQSHAEAVSRHHVMQTQIDTLRQREQWLAAQRAQIERYANLLDRLAAALAAVLQREGSSPQASTANATDLVPPQELARRTVSAREERNRWLSQQMQDGPMLALSNLVLHAEISHRLLGRDLEKGRHEVQGLKEMVVRVLNDTRYFVSELHPPALEELGLRPTVRRYVSELAARSGVEIRLGLPGQDVRLPLGQETALFRIVQEGLRGALDCRPEAGIDLSLAIDSASAVVDLRSGVSPAVAETGATPASLETVATYAEALGGRLVVEGPDERGLHLRVEVPLVPAG